MKRIALFLPLLLSLALLRWAEMGWAENPAQCRVGQPNCAIPKTSAVLQVPTAAAPPVAMTNVPPKKTYVLPSLQEFYYPMQAVYTPAGALFGTKKREEQDIAAYWKTRSEQLDSENRACTELSDDASIKECLQNVRQVERSKTADIRSINERRVTQAHETYMNNIQSGRFYRQNSSSRPTNINCNTFDGTTRCSSY